MLKLTIDLRPKVARRVLRNCRAAAYNSTPSTNRIPPAIGTSAKIQRVTIAQLSIAQVEGQGTSIVAARRDP